MKTGHYFSIVLLTVLAITQSCENDLILNSNNDALPVIYCLLDQDSEDQYLRIGKTYSGQPDYNNQIPPADSLVLPGYRDIYIEEWNDTEIVNIHYFSQINNVQKDTGLFPVESIAVYHSQFIPKPETTYILYVYFPESKKVISGQTITMGETELIDPAPLHVREITFHENRNYILRYVTAENTGIYQGLFTIYYTESQGSGLEFKSFDLTLPVRYSTESKVWVSQTINSPNFFSGFTDNISVNSNTTRELLHADFTLYSAGEDLSYFVKAQIPSFWMNLAQYTNLDNSFGIFSCIRSSSVSNLQFSKLTKYHLATDSLTRDLNFIDPEN